MDIVVVGGGPGGYPAAFEAADRGLKVTLVDEGANLGGVCLNRGCIPSKTLLHVADLILESREASGWGVRFSEPEIDLEKIRVSKNQVITKLSGGIVELCKRRGVTVVKGRGKFSSSNSLEISSPEGTTQTLNFDKAILATGSRPVFPTVFDIGSQRVMDSTGALSLEDIPERLLVVGGGYIGLEMGTVYASLGSSVTVVEMMPNLLPGADPDLVRPLKKRLDELFESIHLNTKVVSLAENGDAIQATLEGEGVDSPQLFDRVLVSIGRQPNTEGLGLEHTNVKLDEKGFVIVNSQRRSDDENIYAIGDISGEPMLAHKATREAKVAISSITGGDDEFEPAAIPAVVFTKPEIAWCGLTAMQAKESGRDVTISKFLWAASGRAQTIKQTDGMTKILCDPESHRILGVGIVGPGAGELIAEAVLAVETCVTAEDLALTIHAHPTLSETMMEAAEALVGQATHMYRAKR